MSYKRAKLKMHDREERLNPAFTIKRDKGRQQTKGSRNRKIKRPPTSAMGYDMEMTSDET